MEDWTKSPTLDNVDPKKLELLTQLFTQSRELSPKELIPFFLSASARASSEGMSFSDSETDLILSVLKQRMPPEDLGKIDSIRKLATAITSRNRKRG